MIVWVFCCAQDAKQARGRYQGPGNPLCKALGLLSGVRVCLICWFAGHKPGTSSNSSQSVCVSVFAQLFRIVSIQLFLGVYSAPIAYQTCT